MFNLEVALEKAGSGSLQLRVLTRLNTLSLRMASPKSTERPLGLLRVIVQEGIGLKSHDLVGKGDPFVVVSYGSAVSRTKVEFRSDHPVWDQETRFWIYDGTKEYKLVLTAYDKDKLARNELIGSDYADINAFLDGEEHELTHDLTKVTIREDAQLKEESAGKSSLPSQGKIRFKIKFTRTDDIVKRFWQSFAAFFDTDGSGALDPVEFSCMLEAVGSTLSDSEADSIFEKLDTDKSGTIDAGEIHRGMGSLREHLALLVQCPICKQDLSTEDEFGAILHIGPCLEYGEDATSKLLLTGFLTPQGARAGVFTKGSAEASATESTMHIMVRDRKTGILVEEKIPHYIKTAMRAMYRNKVGLKFVGTDRTKKMLTKMTRNCEKKFNSPESLKDIPDFIALHKINTEEILEPMSSFKCFNEFFFRKLKEGARPVDSPANARVAVAAADCRLTVFPSIADATRLWIKGDEFTLDTLLAHHERLSKHFAGCSMMICRLSPQDYHRFHSPVEGVVGERYDIPGTYYTVSPLAIRKDVNVFTENRRMVTEIETKEFGRVLFIAVGATMVGSIVFTVKAGDSVKRGGELGYFAFGGSTCIVAFEKDSVKFDDDLVANSSQPIETLIRVGNSVGTASR